MHQPNTLPWIGYFAKMAQVDIFVILDRVQVPQGRSYANRTKIKTQNGARWLTVPILRHGRNHYGHQPIMAINQWEGKVWRKLEQNYSKAAFWGYNDFARKWNNALGLCYSLGQFNLPLIQWARESLRLPTAVYYQSRTKINPGKRMLAIELCQHFECDTYISGDGARSYNDEELFGKFGIKLGYAKWECPMYQQVWDGFKPNMSIIDLIFNCGSSAREILYAGIG
jgi:hypothetical protein